ncbi:MAG: hypothetical protein ABI823_18205, partial [Bryobacteraceae bacterium]
NMTVSMIGDDTLSLIVNAQPPLELEPVRDMRFNVKGRVGFSLEFKKENGAVSEMILQQPNGTFAAKRAK